MLRGYIVSTSWVYFKKKWGEIIVSGSCELSHWRLEHRRHWVGEVKCDLLEVSSYKLLTATCPSVGLFASIRPG